MCITNPKSLDAILMEFPRMSGKIARGIAAYYARQPRVFGNGQHANVTRSIVAAWIRHNLTEYEQLYRVGYSKTEARAKVQEFVTYYLNLWSGDYPRY